MVMIPLLEIYRVSRQILGDNTADFDIRQLLKGVFGINFSDIQGKTATTKEAQSFYEKIHLLKHGYPLQYILGEWEFYSIPLLVGEGVLIPRADTETLVDLSLTHLKGLPHPIVADFCAGSGAISIAIAENLPTCTVYSIELFEEAFAFLEKNIAITHNEGKVISKKQDVFVDFELPPLDMIVSNPPYLTRNEMSKIDTNVTFEPASALFGGEDGLDFYHHITKISTSMLAQGGVLLFECGYTQCKSVSEILTDNGFANVTIHHDLTGNERCVMGCLPLN